MKTGLLFIFIAVLMLQGCNHVGVNGNMANGILIEQARLTASDGTKIAYDYYPAGNKSVILLHMMDKDKSSWDDFIPLLIRDGYSVIAIDLRGHGGSEGNWREFEDADFGSMLLDAEAAGDFLKAKGITDISIIGASIGANIAVKYAEKHPVKKAVLLSPGMDYHKVLPEGPITRCNNPFLIISAEGDAYSAQSSQALKTRAKSAELIIYPGKEHGTSMLSENQSLIEKIVSWIKK